MENTNEISKNKKEQIAIAIGFLLILIVILITLFRSNLFSGEDDAQNEGQIVKEDNGLEYKAITAKDLHKKILLAEENEQPVLLDIRPFQTYADEHIADAINITPEEFPLEQKIDLHKSIIVIGENPEDENIKKTITQLEKEDFKNFMVLAGGMEAWKQLVGVTVNYGNPNSFEDQMKVSYVEGKDLNDALKQNVPTFILDVRTAEEYAKGHIPGAINIPAEELEKRRKEITEK
ncbi:MAG TPA: rhodanese-like domain-containing protein, partial [Candidatus Moranbacteria bacterium]|nr:rhodanese-like domain-containing protein [Candidatus Moranbacteria bacterium]